MSLIGTIKSVGELEKFFEKIRVTFFPVRVASIKFPLTKKGMGGGKKKRGIKLKRKIEFKIKINEGGGLEIRMSEKIIGRIGGEWEKFAEDFLEETRRKKLRGYLKYYERLRKRRNEHRN